MLLTPENAVAEMNATYYAEFKLDQPILHSAPIAITLPTYRIYWHEKSAFKINL